MFCAKCEPQILESLQGKMTKATYELEVAQAEWDSMKAAIRQVTSRADKARCKEVLTQLGEQLVPLRHEYLRIHGHLGQLLETQTEHRKILSGDALRYFKEFHGDMFRCVEDRRPLHNRRPRVNGMAALGFWSRYRFCEQREPIYLDDEAEKKRATLLEDARRFYMAIHMPPPQPPV